MRGGKRLTPKDIVYISIALALLFTFFSFYISYQCSLHITNVNPKLARVDFQPEKSDNGNAQFKLYENGKEQAPAGWMKNHKLYGYSIQNKTYKMTFTLKALKDCKANINLRGPDEWYDAAHKEKGRVEHWIYFYKLIIDGKNMLKKPVAVWHNQPYKHSLQLKAGKEHIIKIRWQKLPFRMWLTQIDWCYFVILLTFYFFVSYKLFFYLTKLKTEQKRSLPDIAFAVLFFALLLIPAANISDAAKSVQENRMLAKKPELFTAGGLNQKFGTQFEQWFSDRFYGRDSLIKQHEKINMLNHYPVAGGVRQVKDEWIIERSQGRQKALTDKEMENIAGSIGVFNQFCHDRKIKCYIEIVPRKVEFMKDELLRKIPADEKDIAQLLAEYLQKHGIGNVVYPLDELQNGDKKDQVFFKTDHHWTEWGAYLGYQALMRRIKQDIPELQPVTESDYDIFYSREVRAEVDRTFWQGYSCKLMMLDKNSCPLNTRYKNYTHKNAGSLRMEWNKDTNDKLFNYSEARNQLKAVVIGNSFTENFSSFLAYTFKTVKKLRSNNKYGDNLKMSRWQKEIDDFKPDILLIVINPGYINHFPDLKD